MDNISPLHPTFFWVGGDIFLQIISFSFLQPKDSFWGRYPNVTNIRSTILTVFTHSILASNYHPRGLDRATTLRLSIRLSFLRDRSCDQP